MIEVISIAHPDLTQTYHLWREPSNGGVVDEDDNVLSVRSTNFTVALAGTPDNLDQKFTINIDTTDPDNLLRKELDRIPLDTTEKILLTYRAYLSDDLTDLKPYRHYKSNLSHIIEAWRQYQRLHQN